MMRVCVLSKDAIELKNLLEHHGYLVVPKDYCDIIITDTPIPGENIPVILYTKQEDLQRIITEVAERFKSLHDSIHECLDMCKKE